MSPSVHFPTASGAILWTKGNTGIAAWRDCWNCWRGLERTGAILDEQISGEGEWEE